ncbi:MAG: hypothetical protein PHC83_07800 [Bacteroidales bacterium]|nr:hypothetical protein [Bacteroidales bacterium]
MVRKIFIGFLILCGIGLVIFIGYILMIVSAFGGFDKDYSVSDLIDNFEKNKTEIYELKRYFNEIVPKNRFVEIEFSDDNTLGRFGIKALDTTAGDPNGPMFLEWDLKINTQRLDSIIKPMGWTRETLKTLKEKLDRANCIQIESGEPAKIGFQRSGMGMYFFNVFDKPIPDSLRLNYNDSCTYILANDRLVLEYGGGAIGSQCFYNKK